MTGNLPWHRFYGEGVADLQTPFPTMLAAWNHQVSTRPDAPAVHFFEVSLSFREIDSTSEALAAALQSRSLVVGDRIAIYLQNDPQFLATMVAAWKMGAVPVAVSPMLRHKELEHVLLDSGAVALVCLDELYAEIAAEVAPRTHVHTVVTTHPLDMTPSIALGAVEKLRIGPKRSWEAAFDWQELISTYAGRRPVPHTPAPSDAGILTYTSGTTGRSKAAINVHSGLVYNANIFHMWWDLRPERDVSLGLAPVFQITGIVAGFGVVAVAGVPMILLHRFNAEESLRAIQDRRATFVVAASTAYIALCNHPTLNKFDVTSLTKTVSGGAPVATALVDRVRAATGWVLRGAYGLTETTSPTHLGPAHIDPPVDDVSGALAVGVPVPGCEVRIVGTETGQDVPNGHSGEIIVRGPMVVPGYWNKPEESSVAIRDGWFHTGDVGKQNDEGWLFVIDRIKDIINAAGYKVYPREVEDVLYQHPAVREAAVIGLPDEYRGETVKAFVSLVSGAQVDSAELVEFCRQRLAAYKYPRSVEFLDDLPKNSGGKVLRRSLRANKV